MIPKKASASNVAYAWAKAMGGSNNDYGYSIKTDSSGNVYTTGNFSGIADFDPGSGIYNLTNVSGATNVFISKLDSSGNFVWAKQIEDPGAFDKGLSLDIDASGNVYITGSFGGTADFDPGSGTVNLTHIGSSDTFVLKLDSSGNFVWVKRMASGVGQSLKLDASSNVYISGYFNGMVDFDPGVGTSNLTSAGNNDIYVSKLDSSGNFVWANSMGGTGNDFGWSLVLDSSNNVYTTGSYTSTVDFDPGAGTSNLTSAGSSDIFVSKLDSSGNFVWAKSMGGTSGDWGNSIGVDSSGNVYTTGYFQGTADFDPSGATSNLTSVSNSWDVFISKLDSSGNFVFVKQIGGSNDNVGKAMYIDSSSNIYLAMYSYSTADFDPGSGTANLTSFGSADSFVGKYDSTGALLWVKQMGGSGDDDIPQSIYVDTSENVYTTGNYFGPADFDPGTEVVNLQLIGSYDIFVSKLSPLQTPTVNAVSLNSITNSTVSITGNISSTGGENASSRGVNYGITNSYGQTQSESGSFGTGNFTVNLTNLNCGTTYHYRLFAANSDSSGYNPDNIFQTNSCGGGAPLPSGGGSYYNPSTQPVPAPTPSPATTPSPSPVQSSTPIEPSGLSFPTGLQEPPSSSGSLSSKIVQLQGDTAIYYITQRHQKIPYPSWKVFLSYNHTKSDIQIITQDELDQYPNVQYVKLNTQPQVYLLEKGKKRYLSPKTAERLGILPEDVLTINKTEYNTYKTGNKIVN